MKLNKRVNEEGKSGDAPKSKKKYIFGDELPSKMDSHKETESSLTQGTAENMSKGNTEQIIVLSPNNR
jgi:hypothetical protein